MNLNASISRACEQVPGLVRASLALLPEGLLIAAAGDGGTFDHEPLVRSAALCVGRGELALDVKLDPARVVEYVFVIDDHWVVIQAGRRTQRLVLAVMCTREANLAFVVGSTRRALGELEQAIDLAAYGV